MKHIPPIFWAFSGFGILAFGWFGGIALMMWAEH